VGENDLNETVLSHLLTSILIFSIDRYLDLENAEFTLHLLLLASISQVMTRSNEKGIRIVNEVAEEIMFEPLYGDSLRLQQVLADFLSTSVDCMPDGGELGFAASLARDHLGESIQLVHLEFRYTNTVRL